MSAPSLPSTSGNIQPTSTQINPYATDAQHDHKLQQEEASDQEAGPIDSSHGVFSATVCLFCSLEREDVDANLLHMRKVHGLMIPAEEHLIVDMESLLGYLYVIIFDLKECIFCHTVRRTPIAVQQHMMAKGHCRIDLESDEAEMLDFYDIPITNHSNRDRQTPGGTHFEYGHFDLTRASTADSISRSANQSSNLYLSSSKTALARGRQLPASSRNRVAPSDSIQAPKTRTSQVLHTRQDRVAHALENRMANLRVNDRSSLVHLPRSQMLSILSTSQKQLGQAQKTERRLRSRLESKNNSTMMKNFKNDVPGPKNG